VEENIEPEKVGIVIGSKGSTIMEIMKKSGAKVVINQEFPKGQPHRILYTGTSLPNAFSIETETETPEGDCSSFWEITYRIHRSERSS
jgi:hypothetical protein